MQTTKRRQDQHIEATLQLIPFLNDVIIVWDAPGRQLFEVEGLGIFHTLLEAQEAIAMMTGLSR